MTSTQPHPSQQPATTFDPDRAEAFGGHLIDVLNGACTALQISVGHQVGLWDVLADLPPSTTEAIARSAGLQERYVREWLAAVVVAGIVEHDPGTGTYVLPAEHAACLTRAAGPENLARIMQFVSLIARVEDRVVHAFRAGGGVPYAAFERFHDLMAEDSRAVAEAALVDGILPLAEGLPDRLRAGIDVADVGCGHGDHVLVMAEAFPASRFVGYDFAEDAIAVAQASAAARGLDNARFEVLDVARLDRPAVFDLVTAFDAIHDQARPAAVLDAVARSLRPGGTFLMVDIKASSRLEDNHEIPWAPFLYTVSTFHCMAVSLDLGGDGLGTMWGRQTAEAMLRDAGFSDVEVHEVDTDPFNLFYVACTPAG